MKSKKHKKSSSIMGFRNLGLNTFKLCFVMIKKLEKGRKKMKWLAQV